VIFWIFAKCANGFVLTGDLHHLELRKTDRAGKPSYLFEIVINRNRRIANGTF
jgi:hypothetical protein